jgi:hypothetical protein
MEVEEKPNAEKDLSLLKFSNLKKENLKKINVLKKVKSNRYSVDGFFDFSWRNVIQRLKGADIVDSYELVCCCYFFVIFLLC